MVASHDVPRVTEKLHWVLGLALERDTSIRPNRRQPPTNTVFFFFFSSLSRPDSPGVTKVSTLDICPSHPCYFPVALSVARR